MVEEDVQSLFVVMDQFGLLYGLVVNVGIVVLFLLLLEMSGECLCCMFDVNVLGSYLIAREGARCMVRSRGGEGGSMVLVSSVVVSFGVFFEYVDYVGVKGAMDVLSCALS